MTIKVTIEKDTKAARVFKTFIAEKADRRLEQQKKAADYTSKLKKPAV